MKHYYKVRKNKGIDGECKVGDTENTFEGGHSVWKAVHTRMHMPVL